MIYGCVREPMPGWVDQVTPLGGVGFPLALGMARSFYFTNVFLDFIPGDIVTNQIIVATAFATTTPVPEFRIFHNSMTGSNPTKVWEFWKSGIKYLKYNPFEQQIRETGFWVTGDKKLYDTVIYLQDDLPAQIMGVIAKIPFIGSKQMQEQITKFKGMRKRIEDVQNDIEKFKTYQWIFENANVQKLIQQLNPEDTEIFLCDPKKIDTMQEAVTHLYGMQKFYLNQDVPNKGSGQR